LWEELSIEMEKEKREAISQAKSELEKEYATMRENLEKTLRPQLKEEARVEFIDTLQKLKYIDGSI
jgi:uncharacterized tellurite resistance protein B-like protein